MTKGQLTGSYNHVKYVTTQTKWDTESTGWQIWAGHTAQKQECWPCQCLVLTDGEEKWGCPPPILATATHSSQLSAELIEGRWPSVGHHHHHTPKDTWTLEPWEHSACSSSVWGTSARDDDTPGHAINKFSRSQTKVFHYNGTEPKINHRRAFHNILVNNHLKKQLKKSENI